MGPGEVAGAIVDSGPLIHLYERSLGVIVRAYRTGRITMNEADLLLRRLQETTTLFVTPAIVDLAIEQLRARGD